jgi:hypothetical protein
MRFCVFWTFQTILRLLGPEAQITPLTPHMGPLRGGVGVIWDFAVKRLFEYFRTLLVSRLFHGILGWPVECEISCRDSTGMDVLAVPRPEHLQACETEGVRAEGADDSRSVARGRVWREWGASTRQTFSDSFRVCFAPFSGTPVPLIFSLWWCKWWWDALTNQPWDGTGIYFRVYILFHFNFMQSIICSCI